MNASTLLNPKALFVALTIFALAGCNTIAIHGSGRAFEVTHTIDNIREIEVNGSGELRIQNGSTNQLIVLAQEEIHDHLDIRQTSDRLIIEPEEGTHFKTSEPLQYLLIVNDIELIELNGALTLVSEEYRTGELYIDASGSTDVDLALYADKLSLNVSGSFDGYLSGSADHLILDFSGSSDINAYDLAAKIVDIDISGAGNAYVSVSEQLNVSAAGASRVSYKGNPRVSQSSAGASSVVNVD